MSSFVINDRSTAALAAMLDRVTGAARWSGSIRYGIYYGRDLYDLLSKEWSTMFDRKCIELDSQKIYAVLRRMNVKAYGERYYDKDITAPEVMPVGEWVNTADRNPWQMLKTFECYLYQCCEGSITKSELYKELVHAKNDYAKYLISKIPDYSEAVWG